MAVHNMPDACGLYSPKPVNDMVKIVGNIIELKSPTNKIDHIATNPLVNIEIISNAIAIVAKIASTLEASIILVKWARKSVV